MPTADNTSRYSIPRGILAATPIVLAYLPVGFALGILASQLSFTLPQATLFFGSSFSGSGQSIGLQMLQMGEPILAIWSVTVIINLRYFLMSSALIPSLRHWPLSRRYLFALLVTDELFALHSTQFKRAVPPPSYVFAASLTPLVAWTLGGVLGLLAGGMVADVRPLGFDFAVPAMFMALIVLQIENRRMVCLGILAAVLSVGLALTPFKAWGVMLASLFCATLGTVWERWKTK
ncbi:AzlC family ABC transporter permease [bacterium]|nr:AzlC family ABC transporter permease [bacterium]